MRKINYLGKKLLTLIRDTLDRKLKMYDKEQFKVIKKEFEMRWSSLCLTIRYVLTVTALTLYYVLLYNNQYVNIGIWRTNNMSIYDPY